MTRRTCLPALAAAGLILLSQTNWIQAQAPPSVESYRLVPGFLPESFGADGMARGTGFATPNPWGAYTAYLLATNEGGQRTWRIENYLPNPAAGTAQGSTMYLFEGDDRALLVDTAQNTPDVPGKNDLKTVVRYLLGHTNEGAIKANPVDFVVANTHSHGDHTGKNRLMSDRTIYYPDLDWPRNGAPANYVPIKEGGGPTEHGSTGQAASEIDLGHRTLVAIDIHEHTPGSTGYLDRDNRMIATGDAIGSAYVWAQFGFITQYDASVHHLQEVLKPFDRIDVLPAHFYQVKQGARGRPPLNGRPLDKQYVDDQVRVADGILAGTVVSEPYPVVGRETVDRHGRLGTGRLHAREALLRMVPPPARGSDDVPCRRDSRGEPAGPGGRFAGADAIEGDFYLIRDDANQSLYLLVGLRRGRCSSAPARARPASRRSSPAWPTASPSTSSSRATTRDRRADSRSSRDIGSYLPAGVDGSRRVCRTSSASGRGDRIELGQDRAARPLTIEVYPLAGHSAAGLTLLDVNDRALFSGDALGTQQADAGLQLHVPLSAFARDLATWRAETDGKYDVVYTAHNYQWFTSPAYVAQVQEAVSRGLSGGASAFVQSARLPGTRTIKSTGPADIVASVAVDDTGTGR